MGFNRTFMELKYDMLDMIYDDVEVLIVPLWNWNQRSTTHPVLPSYVLIVPLWNWNLGDIIRCTDAIAF